MEPTEEDAVDAAVEETEAGMVAVAGIVVDMAEVVAEVTVAVVVGSTVAVVAAAFVAVEAEGLGSRAGMSCLLLLMTC